MSTSLFTLERGTAPLLISLPHDGSEIPGEIAARMLPDARRSTDTDWHVGLLYAPLARALGASLLRPRLSRYVVDLNRPADGHALYPGRRETGLVSTVGFDGAPLYRDGEEPDAAGTKALVAKCLERGLLILSCGVYANTIRMLTPLTASEAVLKEGLDILEAAIIGN